jgi:hypothetical protein
MTEISFVDKSLDQLIRTGVEFPGSDLDMCVGYVSSSGVLIARPMITSARRKRAVVGLNITNRVSVFDALQKLGVEVYVYPMRPYLLFHPKKQSTVSLPSIH